MGLKKLGLIFLCLMTMVSFEVVRDLAFLFPPDSSQISEVATLTEEDVTEKSNESSVNELEMNIDFEEINAAYFSSANIILQVFEAHELSYLILEQKIILPPPEHSIC